MKLNIHPSHHYKKEKKVKKDHLEFGGRSSKHEKHERLRCDSKVKKCQVDEAPFSIF